MGMFAVICINVCRSFLVSRADPGRGREKGLGRRDRGWKTHGKLRQSPRPMDGWLGGGMAGHEENSPAASDSWSVFIFITLLHTYLEGDLPHASARSQQMLASKAGV